MSTNHNRSSASSKVSIEARVSDLRFGNPINLNPKLKPETRSRLRGVVGDFKTTDRLWGFRAALGEEGVEVLDPQSLKSYSQHAAEHRADNIRGLRLWHAAPQLREIFGGTSKEEEEPCEQPSAAICKSMNVDIPMFFPLLQCSLCISYE